METKCAGGGPDPYDRQCPCRDILDLVASRWSALLIGALEPGPLRFGALRRRVDGISQKVLSQTLRNLERSGILTRSVYPTSPPAVEYALTPLGHSVAEPLGAIRGWSIRHLEEVQDARHEYDLRPPSSIEKGSASKPTAHGLRAGSIRRLQEPLRETS